MKKNKFIIIIFFLSILTVYSKEKYTLPDSINLFKYNSNKKNITDLPEIGFYPEIKILGWSKFGKVAWFQSEDTGGKGGVSVTFFISNLVNDTIVYKKTFDGDNYKEYSVENQESTINTTEPFINYIFKNEYNEIAEILFKNEIRQIYTPYNKLPIIYNNEFYKCNIIIKEKNQKNEFWDKIASYKIIIMNKNHKKIITYSDNVSALNIYICGYFLSPFESRVLIVYAIQEQGFEESVLEYKFSGCSLDKGFK